MAKHGKKYLEKLALVDATRSYTPQEAAALVKDLSYAGFDATVEAHLRMGVDGRHADQQVRGIATLPNGTGKKVRILVFTQGEGDRIAREAGADIVGGDDIIQRINEGFLDFDLSIATPDMMGKVGRLGRILGRRGLMPNPRAGTVVAPEDLAKAINEARKGRVEFRLDRQNQIHVVVGKVSFTPDQLSENLLSVLDAIVKAKPSGAKGQYIRNISVAPTMGPGVTLALETALSQAQTGAA